MYVEKIKFSILIKYYCFFFMMMRGVCILRALEFSEVLPLGILAASLYQVHKNCPRVLSLQT